MSVLVVLSILLNGIWFSVVQQPNQLWVSSQKNVLTQYELAGELGTYGILAHSEYAGKQFRKLDLGETVSVKFENETVADYIVGEISYFSVVPRGNTADYIESSTGLTYTFLDMMKRFYMNENKITFQTCVGKNGLVLVVAYP